MANKFFEENNQDQAQNDPQKLKVGETEFTQEELQELVGSGRKLKEIETKQGQPIDDILKSWGKRGERLGEWKKATGVKTPDELMQKKQEAPRTQEELSEDETKNKILAEARKYGLLTKEEIAQAGYLTQEDYQKMEAGRKTLSQVKRVIKQSVREGYPAVTEEQLLEYMSNPKNPADARNAYDLMFKNEIKEIDIKKMQSIKPKGIYIDSASSAGGKQFEPGKITNLDGLRKAMSNHFNNAG